MTFWNAKSDWRLQWRRPCCPYLKVFHAYRHPYIWLPEGEEFAIVWQFAEHDTHTATELWKLRKTSIEFSLFFFSIRGEFFLEGEIKTHEVHFRRSEGSSGTSVRRIQLRRNRCPMVKVFHACRHLCFWLLNPRAKNSPVLPVCCA